MFIVADLVSLTYHKSHRFLHKKDSMLYLSNSSKTHNERSDQNGLTHRLTKVLDYVNFIIMQLTWSHRIDGNRKRLYYGRT